MKWLGGALLSFSDMPLMPPRTPAVPPPPA